MNFDLSEKLKRIDQVLKQNQTVLSNIPEQPVLQKAATNPAPSCGKAPAKKNKAMQQYESEIKKREKEKQMNTLRKSGTDMWQDDSLNDWPPGDYRIFVGDLGNEVNDDHLATAFRKYHSFGKAKVVRCKKSNKSRGYGFVSLMDPQDYLKALREMNGKYIGNRPIKIKASEWQKRGYEQNKNKFKDSKIRFVKKKIVKK